MDTNPLNNLPWSPKEIIQAIPALAIGITATCFVLGLLIVNLRLAKFGIYSSEFMRSEYILAGAAFVFLVAVTRIGFKYGFSDVEKVSLLWKEKKYFRAAAQISIGMFTGFMASSFALLTIPGNNFDLVGWDFLCSIFILYFMGGIFNASYMRVTRLIQDAKSGSIVNNSIRVSRVHGLLVSIPFALLFIASYAYITYPHISSALGGGHKLPVVLTPTARGLEVSKSLALPIQNNQTMVGPIQVLTESEKELVVLIPDALTGKWHTVRLNRELFDAVQTTSPNR
ncbi:MAG: hypothetical protein HY937_01540 [Nitrosomonadales bacterium]|nr:hypothetical protein [Nitrosomonadales bacterium]